MLPTSSKEWGIWAHREGESLDIGSDTGTGVDDGVYQVPFTFTGKINKITLAIDKYYFANNWHQATKNRLTKTED